MSIHAAAVELATKVGPVMPVVGKVPCWKDWPARATRTPNGEPEWQSATGVGLVTGKRAGYFVLDVDAKAGGPEALAKLEAEHGKLPPTWTSHTGGGGAHLFFKCPDFAVKGSAGKLAKGLDVRGEGGQVVAPPSAHPSGTTYQWAAAPWDRELADAPEWLLAMLRPAALAPLPAPRLVHDSGSALRRASAYLQRIPGAISGSGGHDQAWRAALAVVRGFDLSEGDALALLSSEYNPRCSPPWSEREMLHKVRSAAKDSRLASGYLLNEQRAPTSPMRPAAAPKASREPGEDADEEPLMDEGVADFFATAADNIQWALEPYIPKGGFVFIQGAPKSGKTWFAAYLASECVKAGLKVAVVEEEGAREVLRDRLKPFVTDPRSVNDRLRILYRKRIRLDDIKSIELLAKMYAGFDVIVADPFIRMHGKKEKESDEMAVVYSGIQLLMQKTGAAVVLIHHTKKGESWNTGSKVEAGLDDGRGSGTGAGEADNVIAIKALPRNQRVLNQVRFIVENPGSRVGPEFDRKTAVIDLQEGCESPLSWLAEDGDRAGEDDAVDPIEDYVSRIIRSKKLPDNEAKAISGSAIATSIGGNKKAALAAVKRCVNVGVLEVSDGARGPVYWKPEGDK